MNTTSSSSKDPDSKEIQGKIRLVDWAQDHRMEESAARSLANRSSVPLIRQGATLFVDARLMDDAFTASFSSQAAQAQKRREKARDTRKKQKEATLRLQAAEALLLNSSKKAVDVFEALKDARDSNDSTKLLAAVNKALDFLPIFLSDLMQALSNVKVADSTITSVANSTDSSSSQP